VSSSSASWKLANVFNPTFDARHVVITLLSQSWTTLELLAQAPAESRAHYARVIRRALRGKDDTAREKNART
jgi:hypothetical protein